MKLPRIFSFPKTIPFFRATHQLSSFAHSRQSAVLISLFTLAFSSNIVHSLSMASSSTSSSRTKIIDSHLHVWGTSSDVNSYPFFQNPPDSLKDSASFDQLVVKHMETKGVDGALIIQPINYKFDHSYVINAIQKHPTKFKGMLLHDPSLSEIDAISRLEDLTLKGFVGVRFNPYLWPRKESKDADDESEWEPMSSGSGLAVYKRCAELRVPVGIMCFQGLSLHYKDVCNLLQSSPETIMILDHFGFTFLDDNGNNAFQQLLSLEKYPTVIVKISALFRLKDPSPVYENVYKERFLPLFETFGPERLMYGSDFPFVLEQSSQYSIHKVISSWIPNKSDRLKVLSGNAERIFGPWGTPVVV